MGYGFACQRGLLAASWTPATPCAKREKKAMFLEELCRIAQQAGAAILHHYDQAIEFERKADASPVTAADIAAHHVIERELLALAPKIPIISEEHAQHVLPEGATRFWLVDPLDGTKSFIRREGQFTVNIALIEDAAPVLGVIYIPVTGELYFSDVHKGVAWRQMAGEKATPIRTRDVPAEGMTALVSRSHLDEQTQRFIDPLPIAMRASASSSLKFCRVAEGAADIYPRFGPTMEWDTAAGHAIVLGAGGRVEKPDGNAFDYGKSDFRNGAFVAWGK